MVNKHTTPTGVHNAQSRYPDFVQNIEPKLFLKKVFTNYTHGCILYT